MKKILIIILSLTCTTLYSQCLQYTYDAAGNRTQRKLLACMSPPNEDATSMIGQETDETEASIEELERFKEIQQGINVFPNPAEDHMQVTLSETFTDATIELQDLTGHIITKQSLIGLGHSFDLTTYPTGEYILVIRDESFVCHWKIIKIRD